MAESKATDATTGSAVAGAGRKAVDHTPPWVPSASSYQQYSVYLSGLSHYLPASVQHYLPGAAAAAAAEQGGASVIRTDTIVGCSVQQVESLRGCGCCSGGPSPSLQRGSGSGSGSRTGTGTGTGAGAGTPPRGTHARADGLYLCLSYTNGFQVWAVTPGATDSSGGGGSAGGARAREASRAMFRELLSVRDGAPVRFVKVRCACMHA